MALDRTNPACSRNGVQGNPTVGYGASGRFFRILSPGPYIGELELQYCFRLFVASPLRRKPMGARHRPSNLLEVHLFLPFGPDHSSGLNRRYFEEMLRVAKLPRHFVDSLRSVEEDGACTSLFAGAPPTSRLLTSVGASCRAQESKRWRPRRLIPRRGFAVDAKRIKAVQGVCRFERYDDLLRFPFSPAWFAARRDLCRSCRGGLISDLPEMAYSRGHRPPPRQLGVG